MKKLTILLFSILISFNSFGEWTELGPHKSDYAKLYIDVDRIKEHNGYVYFWVLGSNSLESTVVYYQSDCGVGRFKTLTYIFHKLPMGEGEFDQQESENKGWKYAPPESRIEQSIDYACNYVK